MIVIRMRERSDGWAVTVVHSGKVAASEWFADYRAARHASETTYETFADQGIEAEITEERLKRRPA